MENRKNTKHLWIRCAKNGKYYLPASALGEYTGNGDATLKQLAICSLLRKRDYEGFKVKMPAKIFSSRKLGRIMWLSRESDFEVGGNGVKESIPEYCLSTEGAREILKLAQLRCGNDKRDESR
ncbi:MAG: hypothetical protein NT118_01145 [Lentisphaerae bacterium]|nr:hypothetical protein [Lentisphaerota bacterium]